MIPFINESARIGAPTQGAPSVSRQVRRSRARAESSDRTKWLALRVPRRVRREAARIIGRRA